MRKNIIRPWITAVALVFIAVNMSFADPPTVTALSPSLGCNQAAVNITITGTGFFGGGSSSAVTGVNFDDTLSTSLTTVTATSDTTITAVIPMGIVPGNYNVRVTTPGGTNSTSTTKFTLNAFNYKYWINGSGNWSSIAPSHWSTTSGGSVTTGVPGVNDFVIFDTNSSTGTCAVTLDVAANVGGSSVVRQCISCCPVHGDAAYGWW